MEEENLVTTTYAEMQPLTLPDQLRLAIELLDSSPPLPDRYLNLIVKAIESRGTIDSPVVITTVLMLRVAHGKLSAAA